MENNKRDFRLYEYQNGTLRKVGKGKTGPRPHQFNEYEKCENHVDFLRHKHKGHTNTQFLIIEYIGPYNSSITRLL